MKVMKVNWKYTIGEIAIVIVGISIAFLLNNWNTQRLNNKQKNLYLASLSQDVNEEIKQLEYFNSYLTKKINSSHALKTAIRKHNNRKDTLVYSLFKLASFEVFKPENSTYNTLINSGDMKLIKEFKLRRSIEKHYASHKTLVLSMERIQAIHKTYLGDFFHQQNRLF
jgi:hypothetical protein